MNTLNALISHLEVQRALHGGDTEFNFGSESEEPSQRGRSTISIDLTKEIIRTEISEQDGRKRVVLVI